jgi:hypothetical protein
MDDQLNDDTTCGSIDSTSRGINITPRVKFLKIIFQNKNIFF